MAELTKLTSQDREHLKNIGFGALPDNPSQKNYSAKEIKGASTRPNLQLFDWIKDTREYINSDGVIHMVDNLEEATGFGVGSIVMLHGSDGSLSPYVVGENGTFQVLKMESTTELYNIHDLVGLTYELDDGTEAGETIREPLSIVSNIIINGVSLNESSDVILTLGAGLKFENHQISLTTNNLPEVVPKSISLSQQEDVKLLAISGGETAYVSASNFDYTRLKVQREENLSAVDENDFLFIKED